MFGGSGRIRRTTQVFEGSAPGRLHFTKEQKEAVLEMLIVYVGEDYREKAKAALLHNVDDSFDIEFPWTRLFYDILVNLDKDEEFIKIILSSVIGRRILGAFLDFVVEETGGGLKNCANFILQICKNLVEIDTEKSGVLWLYQENISKMVISLYDACSDDSEVDSDVALQCLDLWDIMYEKQMGMVRELTKKMMEV